jgi:hypothetical protein
MRARALPHLNPHLPVGEKLDEASLTALAEAASVIVKIPDLKGLAARGASLDSREKGLCNSQRRFVECEHGDGPKREAATPRTALDCAYGVDPDGGASFV